MDVYPNQSPIDREVNINSSAVLMCKINADGIIEYVNPSFSEASGYEEFEIIGETIDILKHPDVPQVIYDVLKERMAKKEPIRLIMKQLAKDGRYFWVLSDYETKVDDSGNLIAYYSHSVTAPTYAVHKISSLYKILTKIESKTTSTEVSKRYLIGFLEERNLNYNQFIDELSKSRPEYEKPIQQRPAQVNNAQKTAFQNQDLTSGLNDINHSTNFDISKNHNTLSSSQQSDSQIKKKKSLLKKVFGK